MKKENLPTYSLVLGEFGQGHGIGANIFAKALAAKHTDTRFLKMKVENAPFLVVKLKVQVLPCVVAFANGVSVDRIVGFEGLGYTEDTFTTKDLEGRLLGAGVLQRARAVGEASVKWGVKAPKKAVDDDEEWD